MYAKKCDRCGAFYEKNTYQNKKGRMILSKVRTISTNDNIDRNMDFCDKCFREFEEFLNPIKMSGEKSGRSWAELEVELACERDSCDYSDLCYKSALKAYNSLMEDGHSNHSIGHTMYALNRLVDYIPLTPIEDIDDVWSNAAIDDFNRGYKSYQCKRKPSLFKDVYMDGTVKFHDNNYCYCVNINNQSATFSNKFVSDIIHEMFPIKMPYFPVKPMKVVVEDFLYDEKNGDYDTMGILYLINSDGQRIDINKYFVENENGELIEISKSTYTYRKNRQVKKG